MSKGDFPVKYFLQQLNIDKMTICLFVLLEHRQIFLKNQTQAEIGITISLPEKKSTNQCLN